MERVAVIAHRAKSLGGGLVELREGLARAGIVDPLWFEVPKSRQAPARVREAVEAGAEVVLVWGGDGMVQRSIDVLAGTGITLAIIPAGTANLLATNLGVPHELHGALQVALYGRNRQLDVGRVNGERFAVLAGVGFDARMVDGADGARKERLGTLAYVVTGLGATRAKPMKLRIDVDGTRWFSGSATCALVGNVGTAAGGLVVFPQARPDDGVLDVGVITAEGPVQWLRVLARASRGQAARSRYVTMTKARKVDVRIGHKARYELDGGARKAVARLRFRIEPRAVTVRVPT
jgi:YegS/Rv2252/BmrU family lipid kinase